MERGDTYDRPDTVAHYDLLRTIPDQTKKRYAELVLQAMGGESILELGFGTGNVLIPMSQLGPEKEIVGLDKSPEMMALVEPQVQSNVQLVSGSLTELNRSFDALHFKAMLHCIDNPHKMIQDMIQAVKPGGLIITSHEYSLTEDRIEQLFQYCAQQDQEVEQVFQHYFQLRQDISKPFAMREFPAGDSSKIAHHFTSTGDCTLTASFQPESLHFEREITIQDILTCIHVGTFGVFYDGLTEQDRSYLHSQLNQFCATNTIDIAQSRTMSCGFHINVLRKHDCEPDIDSTVYLKQARPDSDLPPRTQALLAKVEGHTEVYQVPVCGRQYLVYPNVFSPKYFVNSEFYAKKMAAICKKKPEQTMLEIGCGTGVVAIESALAGATAVTAVDINPQAVLNTQANSQLHQVGQKLACFKSDTYSQVPSQEYDLLFYNTPFCYTANQLQVLEMSVADRAYQSVSEYILEAHKYLAPDGKLYLGISYALSNFELITGYLTAAGFTWQEVASTQLAGITHGEVYSSLIECTQDPKAKP